ALACLLDFQPGSIDFQGDAVADLLSLRDGGADLGIGLMQASQAAAALEQADLDVDAAVQERSSLVLRPEEVGGAGDVDPGQEVGGGHPTAGMGGTDRAKGGGELSTVVHRQLQGVRQRQAEGWFLAYIRDRCRAADVAADGLI